MPLTLNRVKVCHFLLLLSIYLLPFFTISEQLYFYGLTSEQSDVNVFIKSGKDIIFILIYLVGSMFMFKNNKYPHTTAYFGGLFFLFLLLALLSPSYQAIIAGARWCHMFFLFFFCWKIIDAKLVLKCYKAFKFIFYLQVISQIVELFYMPPLAGYNSLGLANRVTGLFVNPSAAGAFASAILLMFILFEKRHQKYFILLIIASLMMAMSSTGVALSIMITFLYYSMKSKYYLALVIVFVFLLPIVYLNLDMLSGREAGSIEISGGTRLNIISDVINNIQIVSSSFGLATNSAMSMKLPGAFIADSTITSMSYNLGFIGLIYVFIPIIIAFVYSVRFRLDSVLLFLVWVIGVSLPIIIMELFPLNLIAVILGVYFYKAFQKNEINLLK